MHSKNAVFLIYFTKRKRVKKEPSCKFQGKKINQDKDQENLPPKTNEDGFSQIENNPD